MTRSVIPGPAPALNSHLLQIALIPDLNDIPFLSPDPIRELGPGETQLPDPSEESFMVEEEEDYAESSDDGSGSGSGSLVNLPPEGSGQSAGPDSPRERNPMDGWFPGEEIAQRERDLFDSLGCREHFLIAKKARTSPMPKDCERLLYSISFLTFQVMLGGCTR